MSAPKPSSEAPAARAPARRRDERIDFFRGLALWFIFIDHIPQNFLANFTLHGIGFSDAAFVFVFLAGYAAVLAYGRTAEREEMVRATANAWRRVWHLYVAHILLFVLLTAQVSYSVRAFSNPMFYDEMGVSAFLEKPHELIVEALLLRYQPTFLDILPLYIVLLAAFPLVLLALRRHWLLALVPSVALYLAVQVFRFTLHTYPGGGSWTFNPFAWQILLVLGAVCSHLVQQGRLWLPRGLPVLVPLIAVLAGSAVITVFWTLHEYDDAVPAPFLGTLIPLLGKPILAPVRLAHFLMLVWFVAIVVPAQGSWLRNPLARALVLCGRHSLQVFGAGILMSVLGHFVFVELGHGLPLQIAVNFIGCALMVALAGLIDWYGAPARAARTEGGRP